MRFWIPYDALYYYNGSACAYSPSFGNGSGAGAVAFDHLIWDIQGAEQLGLTPDIVIAGGSGNSVPVNPLPGYGTSSSSPWAGWRQPDEGDYYCGVDGLIGWTRLVIGTSAVPQWEAYNEPDAQSTYNGSQNNLCGNNTVQCGPAEAAELWYLAQTAVFLNTYSGERIGVASLTSAENTTYENGGYINTLGGMALCAQGYPCDATIGSNFPTYWAVHDYNDPSAGGTKDLTAFQNNLGTYGYTGQRVWVTESGNHLSGGGKSDRNRSGPCTGNPLDSDSDDTTLASCVENSTSGQTAGATAWLNLAGSSTGGSIATEVFWYEFTAFSDWDSALVDGTDAHARPSFCTVTGWSTCDAASFGHLGDYLQDGSLSPTAGPLSPTGSGETHPSAVTTSAPGEADATHAFCTVFKHVSLSAGFGDGAAYAQRSGRGQIPATEVLPVVPPTACATSGG